MEFGACYIDPALPHVKCKPFVVENVYSSTLSALVTSNMQRQVVVFADEALSTPATAPIPIEPGGSVTVYVALMHRSSERFDGGESREMVRRPCLRTGFTACYAHRAEGHDFVPGLHHGIHKPSLVLASYLCRSQRHGVIPGDSVAAPSEFERHGR